MLKPNNKQNTRLFEMAGAARFAYNWTLNMEIENYEQNNNFLNDGQLRKEFTLLKRQEEYSWLNNISNDITKQAIKDACNAYIRFFKKITGFPKFNKLACKNSPSSKFPNFRKEIA